MALLVAVSFCIGVASATQVPQRPVYYKKWRDDPKMVVFGDSTSDVGRRFNAPSSFDFDDLGPFPWVKMFEAPGSESKFRAYLPAPGSATNGKVWPSWLRVPEDLNFATGSGTASDAFRSRERCTGYIGDGEALPTATLGEQITRYSHDVLDYTDDTLDHTHIIMMGTNDMNNLILAASRYNAGGVGYVDPVAFENVFEVVDGVPGLTFEPMVRELVGAWQEGIIRLIERGVTGRILLANLPSPRGLPGLEVELANALDLVSLEVRAAAKQISQAFAQVRVLDVYRLTGALVDHPAFFEDLGFTGGVPSGSSLTDPCFVPHFAVDYEADIMGTQGDRAAGCQEECALCADGSSPCQNCLEGYPSATVCDNPERYVFWDALHFTTEIHHILGEAIRQCSKDRPNYGRDWVKVLCVDETVYGSAP